MATSEQEIIEEFGSRESMFRKADSHALEIICYRQDDEDPVETVIECARYDDSMPTAYWAAVARGVGEKTRN